MGNTIDSNETNEIVSFGVGEYFVYWNTIDSNETNEVVLFGVGEYFVHWKTIDSNETNEIVSFGVGEYFVASKRDCLVWGWRIFVARQARLSHMGVGQGHTLYNPHDITYFTNLLGSFSRSLWRSIRVRVQRLVCFYFPYLSDTHGYSRILTDTHGYSWILTDTHGFSPILTDTHRYSWKLTDT